MVCTNRQLAQSDRTAAFSSNAAVIKQLRALPNHATPDQVKGWLQHELHPAVQHVRSRLNEAYPHYARNAPSGNPLYYLFKEDTAASDPQFGFIKFDQAVQNTSATIRVSEKNAKLQSIIPWLTIMQGSGTSPLGVLTLADSKDPTRFIRFNLNSMIDQGTYWDLGVTPVESSTASPFVGGGETFVSFIPGVASGGVVPATTIPYLRAMSLVSLAGSQLSSITNATGSLISSGTVFLGELSAAQNSSFSIANVRLRMSGNTLLGMASIGFIAGTRNVPAQWLSVVDESGISWQVLSNTFAGFGLIPQLRVTYQAPRAVSAGTQSMTIGTLSFADSNGVTWGMSGSSQITASVAQDLGLFSHVGGNAVSSATRLAFSNASGVTWSLSTAASAATVLASVNDQSVAVVSHVGGNVVSSLTRLAFSNASNVTWSLSTAAGAATVLASVAAQSAQTFIGGLAAGTQTATSGTIVFSNSNDFSFGMSGSTQVTASYQQQFGLVSHIGGNVVSSVRSLAFSNASNVTFSLSTAANAATVIASVAAGGGGGMAISAGTQSVSTGTLVLSNSNNVSFGMSGSSRMTASFALNLSAGTTSNNLSGVTFQNGNNVSFGLNASTVTASYALNVTAGASSANVSVLAFTNTNNVGFAASTDANGATIRAAASIQISAGTTNGAQSVLSFANSNGVTFGLNASTITASVNAGGGVAIAAGTQTGTSGTVVFTQGTNVTAGAALASVNNVVFEMTNSSQIQATALMRVTANVTTTGGFQVSKINFVNGGGVTFGVATSNDAEGRGVEVTAKLADLGFYQNFYGNADANFVQANGAAAMSSVWFSPLDCQGRPMPGNITVNTLGFQLSVLNVVATNSTWGNTLRMGLYTMVNSTQLSLVNSFSATQSASTQGGAQRSAAQSGRRNMSVHSSQWSSQPVLSAGVMYWIAWAHSQNNLTASIMMAPIGGGGNYSGFLGESVSATFMRFPMFGGALSTTGIPGSIGATQILTQTSIVVNAGWSNAYKSVPAIVMHNSYKVAFP